MEELLLRLFIYLLLRRILNKEKLRVLTGLSLEIVSQLVKKLTEHRINEKDDKKTEISS
jgi:hypothetical protein